MEAWHSMPARELFASQAKIVSQQIAVELARRRVSSRELDVLSSRLVHYLGEQGVARDLPVAVLMERTPELIVARLVTLKAGAALTESKKYLHHGSANFDLSLIPVPSAEQHIGID